MSTTTMVSLSSSRRIYLLILSFLVALFSHDVHFAFSFVVVGSCGRSNGALLLHRSTPSSSSPATTTIIMQQSSSSSSSSRTSAAAVVGVIPSSWDEMVRQVASAIKEASADGKTRQIVRVLLPRDATSGDFGKYLESESASSTSSSSLLDASQISLVPPDESWQGGIMQLYRAAAPTGERIVRQVMTTRGGLPPRIVEDRSVDESGVDGVGLLQTSDGGKVTCWIQPCQESVDQIVAQSAQKAAAAAAAAKKAKTDTEDKDNNDENNLIILLNPQWRLVDDAIDEASKKSGFLGGLANMLGGKGGALKQVANAGFVPVYTLEGYVCRGANVRLLQVYNSKNKDEEVWSVFCERDDGESFIPVGSQSKRPTYQQVEAMMNEAGIGYKYARDMGMNPKL